MASLKRAMQLTTLSKWLADDNLTKKASLNALAAALEYGGRLLVGFVLTPFLVSGLGDYSYGVWQTLSRLIGYLSPASGRATQALKWTIANQQASSDYEEKRRAVGSAMAVWLLFLPLLTVLGAVVAWFAPVWLKAPLELYWVVRLGAGLLVLALIVSTLGEVPRSVLEGENLGYKRMGLSTILIIVGGGFTALALYLETGLVGVATAALASGLLTGSFFFYVARANVPWFGMAKPSLRAVRQFLGLSWWFLIWNLVMQLILASDIVILGIVDSAETVTVYTLTKYAPETLISLVAIVVWGIMPGLGGVIGSGDFQRAVRVRSEIMTLTWLIATVLGATVLLWDRAFVGLWVGQEYYAGSIPTLLIMAMVMQLVLIRNDANIIDLTLDIRRKVLLGVLSTVLSLTIATVLVRYFNGGITGLCIGFIVGRSILSVGYPLMIGRFLGVSLYSQLGAVLRPVFVTVVLFSLATMLGGSMSASGWLALIFLVGATFGGVLLLTFYSGLSGTQRARMLTRVRQVMRPTV